MGSHAGSKRGRPAEQQKNFLLQDWTNVEWQTENTCFGAVKKNKDREVLIPCELFEDMEMQLSALPESNIFILF